MRTSCTLGCGYCSMDRGYHGDVCCRGVSCVRDGYELRSDELPIRYGPRYSYYDEWRREEDRRIALQLEKEKAEKEKAALLKELAKNNELEVEHVTRDKAATEQVKEKKHA